MENEILDTTEILGDDNIDIIDSGEILGDEDNTQTQQLAKDLLSELQNLSQMSEEDQVSDPDDEEVESNADVQQIDYSEQLSNIYDEIVTLNSNVDSVYQSQLLLQSSIEDLPSNIRSQYDDVISFQYLTLSLLIGLIVSILFFMGLKK